MTAVTLGDLAKDIRDIAAEIIDDDEQVTLAQSVATYLETTEPLRNVDDQRVFLAELAFAYLAGYEHATAGETREVYKVLRAVGLSI